ncbi:MAG TPA: translocation/assembly module TamB domain-containing protein [Acidobacteriaceae bacterium]|nr:translocation/assembly module TamB domain-containing protein [Acidobacteriaceae bacterium]
MSTARPFPPEHHPQPGPRLVQPPAPRRRRRWGRYFAWTGIGILGLIIVIALAVTVLLHSQRFHRYILAKAQASITQSLNARVDVQNFALGFSPLGLDVYGVVVHGASPYPNPPVLQLEHAHVGIGITSLLHRKWYLTDVRLDRPVVQVFVDKNGVSNIPKPRPSTSNSKSSTNLWDLGIRHAILDRGEIHYNAQATPLSADLHDLELRASYSTLQKMYSGNLKYSEGRVVFGSYRPFVHNFDAAFDLTPSVFRLRRAQLLSVGGATQANLTATATNFSAPEVQAQYDVTIDGAQMGRMMQNASVPAGLIHLAGSANYQQVPNVPALQTVTLSGDLTSRQLVIRTSSLRAAIDGLVAHYSLDRGNAVLRDLRAGLLGGELTARGTMQQIGGTAPRSQMTASLRHISLSQVDRLVPSGAKQPLALRGELNADARAAWGKTMNDLVAKGDATIHGNASSRQQAAAASSQIPLESAIHATYTAANQQATLTRSYVRLPQTTLTMNGTVSNRSSLAVNLQARDLHEVASLAEIFRTPAPGQPQPQPLDLAGSATFTGNVTGSTSAPHLTGQLVTSNLRFNGSTWRVFRTGIEASPSQARLINADLEPAPRGRITANASVGLQKWAFAKTSPLQVELNASQLDIASLASLAGKDIPVSGTLNTHVNLHGSEENPEGAGTLSVTNASAYNEPIHSVQANFNGKGDQAQATMTVDLPAGTVHGLVTVWPKKKTYNAEVTSPGIAIDKLETVKAKNLGAAGNVAINVTGQGSFDNPQLKASVQIPSLTIRNQQVADVKLNADVANHVANATLTSAAVHTNIQAKARVNLTGDYQTDATLDTQNIPLQPIVAVYSPANATSLSGSTELHATVHGPIKNKAALEAHVSIPYLKLAYNNSIQLATTAPIRADYKNSVLTLQHSAIKGTDTNLEFQGSVPVGNKGPMSLLLRGNVNLQLAQLFIPDIQTSGDLRFNIDSHGFNTGAIGGEIDIVNASYASPSMPVGLQNGNGVLKLTTDRVNIQSFHGTVGGGDVTASGGVVYRPAVQFNLAMAAKDIRLLYPEGMREAIDANIHLAGTTENALLGGTVNLTNITFTPAFDLTSFAGQFSSGVAPPPTVGGITQNIHLNLTIRSSNNVNLVSRTLSVAGSANLRVRGTADNPVILGRINLTGGDMILNGDRFVLTGATVQFVNPTQTQPVVNATVTTSIQQYNISMRFRGPTDHMETQYSSDPALPRADIIHLLAFGNTTEAAANAPATPANQMAESLVANQVSSQITSRVARVAGISQLSISPVLGNAQNNQAGANITIQQRVTGNLFITFTDNTAQGTQTVEGQYKVTPHVSISATRKPNGGFAADVLIKKEH